MKPSFDAIDAAILTLIGEGVDTFGRIHPHQTLLDAVSSSLPDDPKPDPYRITDKRLQALRKAGKITLVRPGPRWALA